MFTNYNCQVLICRRTSQKFLTRHSSSRFVLCVCKALSVIDNVLLLTAFPVRCIPVFFEYFYPGLNYEHPIDATTVYISPVSSLAQAASIWITVLVGVNRYIVVCKPFKVKNVFFCYVCSMLILKSECMLINNLG